MQGHHNSTLWFLSRALCLVLLLGPVGAAFGQRIAVANIGLIVDAPFAYQDELPVSASRQGYGIGFPFYEYDSVPGLGVVPVPVGMRSTGEMATTSAVIPIYESGRLAGVSFVEYNADEEVEYEEGITFTEFTDAGPLAGIIRVPDGAEAPVTLDYNSDGLLIRLVEGDPYAAGQTFRELHFQWERVGNEWRPAAMEIRWIAFETTETFHLTYTPDGRMRAAVGLQTDESVPDNSVWGVLRIFHYADDPPLRGLFD